MIAADTDLDALFKRLHLANARRVWRGLIDRAERERWTYRDFLTLLATEEIAHRQQTRLARLTRRAHFPFLKTIDDFNFTYQSSLRLQMLGSALSPDFVTEGRSLILSGKPGRGKTHLAVAVAYRAIQNGFDAFFTTAAALIDDLSAAFRAGALANAFPAYTHPAVLVVDEVGYLTYGTDAANMLFHVVNERHRRHRPMIFTTNKSLKGWGRVLHDEDLAQAIIDRVLERGRLLRLDGPSVRTLHVNLDDAMKEDSDQQPDLVRISGKSWSEFPEPTRLLLVNWSRVSRSAPAFLWYLAFPFTLLNLARAMHPVNSVQLHVHLWAVRIASGVISAATAVWIFAIVETLFRWVRLPVAIEGERSYITAGVAWMSLCIPMLYRAVRPESDGHRAAALVHVLIVSAVTLGALLVKPAQVQIDLNSRFSVFAVEWPTDSQLDQMLKSFSDPSISKVSVYDFPQWLDVIAVASYSSLLAIGFLALVLFAFVPAAQNTRAAATGLALIVSAALLNLFASSIFIASKRLASSAAASSWVFFLRRGSYHPSEAMVSGRFGESFATSISAGVAAAILLVMIVVTLCVVWPRPLHWWRTSKPRLEVGLWAHKVVGSLSQKLVLVFVLTAIPLLVLDFAVVTLLERYIDASWVHTVNGVEGLEWPPMYYWMSYIVSLLGLVVFFSIRNAHRLRPVRETLALIADIAGFWAISVHPLGARTYRFDVVRGVLDAIRKSQAGRVVLVGHSQGSVIAAWALGGVREGQVPPSQDTGTIKPSLITCGSPLCSLYQTLFPAYFDRKFFLRVKRRTSQWTNFWRETDPIATKIELPGVENSKLDDPPANLGDALGHSDYWIAPDQLQKVAEFLHPQVAKAAT